MRRLRAGKIESLFATARQAFARARRIVPRGAAQNCAPHARRSAPVSTRHLEQCIRESVTLDNKQTNNEDAAMDKDRIKGSAAQAKGAVKETVGKAFGDKKLETEGKTDKAAGKVQNAVGGLKDAVRGK
jgi:uncharacterized protein YjbJ (UPF0337 family)